MESAENTRILDNVVMSEVTPQFMLHRLPENAQLLSSELLPQHNGLVVDLGVTDIIPVNYTSEDLLTQDLTEEDRHLAAALVAVQLSQQQKQQQLSTDAAISGLVSNHALGSEILDKQQQLILGSEKASPGFLQIVGTDSVYIEKNTLPKLTLTEADESANKLEEEKRDSDCENRIDARASKKNLPHKKRISRKLNKKSTTNASLKKHKCNLCEQTFQSNDEFQGHQLLCQTTITPLNQMKFACQICNCNFTDQLKFFEHLKSHYEPVPAQSSATSKEEQSSSSTNLEPQKEEMEKESILSSLLNLTCLECNKTFRRQKTYEAHMRDYHTKEELNEFSEPEDLMEGINVVVEGNDPPSDCDDDKEWYCQADLKQAEEDLRELEAEEHVCHICQQPFPLRAILLQHMITCRATTGNIEPTAAAVVRKKNKIKKNNLECSECDRVFTHRNSLLYHIKSHTGIRPHQCDQCGKSFFASSALKVHLRLHTGVKPYHCEQCGKDFRQWGDLKYHITSIHSNEKAFQCEYCGKDFARKYSLIVHRRIHTGERNYKCEFCAKTFRASSYLHNHRRIHTGEKPHNCEICGKPFRVRSDMKRHMKTHGKRRNSAKPAFVAANVPFVAKKEVDEPISNDNTTELHISETEFATETLQNTVKSETLYTNGHQLFFVSYTADPQVKTTVEQAWIAE